MFIVNKILKYQKNESVKNKLNEVIKSSKREENRMWAKKMVE